MTIFLSKVNENSAFDANVGNALNTVDLLTGFSLPVFGQEGRRKFNGGKKRGPAKTCAKVKIYNFSEVATVPRLT